MEPTAKCPLCRCHIPYGDGILEEHDSFGNIGDDMNPDEDPCDASDLPLDFAERLAVERGIHVPGW
jgi:hypothetical protein